MAGLLRDCRGNGQERPVSTSNTSTRGPATVPGFFVGSRTAVAAGPGTAGPWPQQHSGPMATTDPWPQRPLITSGPDHHRQHRPHSSLTYRHPWPPQHQGPGCRYPQQGPVIRGFCGQWGPMGRWTVDTDSGQSRSAGITERERLRTCQGSRYAGRDGRPYPRASAASAGPWGGGELRDRSYGD